MRLVAISDTHGLHGSLSIPDGDVLVHAGDLTRHGELDELLELNDFFAALPHRHKVVVAGNHDWCFQQLPEGCRELLSSVIYLQDEAVTIDGVRFYGSPWQPRFFDWAFNLPRGPRLRAKWLQIPRDTDVLITHGPPQGIGDRTLEGDQAGCADLREIVERIRPRLHIFGHIHEGAGAATLGRTTFVNASSVDRRYRPVHAPVVLDL
jgi:Icc-related predicted phosphoesterase